MITKLIAKKIREVYVGPNWPGPNIKDVLADVTWEQAMSQVNSFNTILVLLHHIHYYIVGVTKVLEGGPLETKDELSFDPPKMVTDEEWRLYVDQAIQEAEYFAQAIEKLPDDILVDTFVDEKTGSYYRNLQGIVEHANYHLGQIVLIKKLLNQPDELIDDTASLN